MYFVLFLGQGASQGNQSFNTKNADSILVVLLQLSEDWEKFLDNVLLLKLG